MHGKDILLALVRAQRAEAASRQKKLTSRMTAANDDACEPVPAEHVWAEARVASRSTKLGRDEPRRSDFGDNSKWEAPAVCMHAQIEVQLRHAHCTVDGLQKAEEDKGAEQVQCWNFWWSPGKALLDFLQEYDLKLHNTLMEMRTTKVPTNVLDFWTEREHKLSEQLQSARLRGGSKDAEWLWCSET